MTDIVERLRLFDWPEALGVGDFSVCTEGADEIERLRAERDAHRDAHAAAQNVLDALYGERDRLRAERDEAISGRDTAIRYLVAHAREAGSWQGIVEGKDIVIRQLEAERDRLREALRALADIDGSSANVASAEVLASRVRNCARAALKKVEHE
jgi:uncharacterized small protein (DUF1192 family)